jgi:hypothetical protein
VLLRHACAFAERGKAADHMLTPTKDEFEPWEGGVRHKPTGIRVSLAYQNERGDWTLNCLLGEAGRYDEMAVIQLGGCF